MNSTNLKLWRNKSLILEEMFKGVRNHSTKPNLGVFLEKLRPVIMKRIEERAKDYPVKPTLPVAREVIRARNALYDGVSTLIHHIPVWACKHRSKNKVHEWVEASINDIIVPVECYHLQKMFQNANERFDHQRIPAVVELCLQVGVDVSDQNVPSSVIITPLDDLKLIARETMNAWEALRFGVHKLLFAYPARVCKHCEEVHVGPSGHRARACGALKYETHLWKKAGVDDLVPPNVVWSRRRQDPCVLVDRGREYYGHAPAVVDLCSKAGALVPSKYFCMMKVGGFTAPV